MIEQALKFYAYLDKGRAEKQKFVDFFNKPAKPAPTKKEKVTYVVL